jgi:hypothetical protein
MVSSRTATPHSALAWFVAIPNRREFTQPQFNFGERVKFYQEQGGERTWETGCIIGMKFDAEHWLYSIVLDSDSSLTACGVYELTAKEQELQLVHDSCAIRQQLQTEQAWVVTAEAAIKLGITPEQLRKLRINGLFKQGYHYRDTSVPGSGLPRWQWHVERCGKALESPAEKRKGCKIKN